MAKIVFDFTNVEDRPARLLTEGSHTAKIKKVDAATTKAGSPMLNVTYEIIDGPNTGDTFLDRITIQDNTMWRVDAFLKALTGKKVDRKKLNIDTDKWIGKKIGFTVTTENGSPYRDSRTGEMKQGLPSSNVASYFFVGAAAAPVVEEASLDEDVVEAEVVEEDLELDDLDI